MDDAVVQDVSDVRAEILSQATEDLTGVYEAWWTANSMRPALPLSARLALAEEALRSLVAEGLVTISRGSWKSQVQVPFDEIDELLLEYDTWVVGEEHDRVFFEATEKGRRAYGLPE